jgi:hypothetical protein
MPHSTAKRKSIVRRIDTIDKHLTKLQQLHQKHLPNAQVIHHPKVKLGTLRENFSLRHKKIPDRLLNNVANFTRVPIDLDHPLFIYAKDGGLLAYRTSLHDNDILNTLTKSLKELPPNTNHSFRGVKRGPIDVRHYCVWSAYSKKPFVSRELREDGKAGLAFLKKNQKLWDRLSDILGQISPATYRQFLRYPLPKPLERFCTAWAGCVVNLGNKDPVQCKPHRDVKESILGFSCVVPAGNYNGGALILYDLEMIIELGPGDVFMFPDSLIHHANEDVTGERSSVVAFTQENLFDYWRRKFGYVNNKDKRKSKSHSQKVLDRVKQKIL